MLTSLKRFARKHDEASPVRAEMCSTLTNSGMLCDERSRQLTTSCPLPAKMLAPELYLLIQRRIGPDVRTGIAAGQTQCVGCNDGRCVSRTDQLDSQALQRLVPG